MTHLTYWQFVAIVAAVGLAGLNAGYSWGYRQGDNDGRRAAAALLRPFDFEVTGVANRDEALRLGESRRHLLHALLAERTEVERLGKALELACARMAEYSNCPSVNDEACHFPGQCDEHVTPAGCWRRTFLTEADKLLAGDE